MYAVLNMELEPVSLVLKNETNEITVCTDQKSGAFYTVILIDAAETRRTVAGLIGKGEWIGSSDYIGSFTHRSRLGLVFRYYEENRLATKEVVYISSFAQRKELALSLLRAYGGSGAKGQVAALLLADRNLNISPSRQAYFNYFLDFDRLEDAADPLQLLSEQVYGILSREYKDRYDGTVHEYPMELHLGYKMLQNKSFHSENRLITYVKELPDQLRERRRGLGALLDWVQNLRVAWKGRWMPVFVGMMVLVTALYVGYQVVTRSTARRETAANTSYVGLDYIGDVYLGNREI